MSEKEPIRAVDGQYVVSLQVFEGPLDMLLHLIRIHEIDIFNIPIGFLTQKYLEYLDLMKEMNLDLASEFVETAAWLTYIKSRMMLPPDPNAQADDGAGEPGPDPREELVRVLLEYQKYKTAAEEIARLPQAGRDTFTPPPRPVEEERDLAPPGLFALMEALREVLSRAGPDDAAREISVTQITIRARILQIHDVLRVRRRVPFLELFEGHATRSAIVITFLAILEMTRINLTRLHQAGPDAEIHVSAAAEEVDAQRILSENTLEEP